MKSEYIQLIVVAGVALIVGAFAAGHRAGYLSARCPPVPDTSQRVDSLDRVAVTKAEEADALRVENAALWRAVDSLQTIARRPIKQRLAYAYSSTYGLPVGAIVNSLLAEPDTSSR